MKENLTVKLDTAEWLITGGILFGFIFGLMGLWQFVNLIGYVVVFGIGMYAGKEMQKRKNGPDG